MSKTLEKTSKLNNPKQASLLSAIKNGGPVVWLSCLIMGFGNIMAGQIIKGLLLLPLKLPSWCFCFCLKVASTT